MSRWFRHYAGMMRDEKLVRAALASKQPVERVLWVWGAILESAAEVNDGGRFDFDPAEAAYFLRADEADVCAVLNGLTAMQRVAGDRVVNWGSRQFESDNSASRQAAYRKRQQERHADDQKAGGDVEVTAASRHGDAPETETETEKKKDTEADASGAAAPVYTDSKHELWGEGIPILESLGVKNARPIVGRWMKDTKDDAHRVLGAIQRARDASVTDPIPWITRALSTEGNRAAGAPRAKASRSVQDVARELLAEFRGETPEPPPPMRVVGSS